MEEIKVAPKIRRINNLIKRKLDAGAGKAQLDRLTGLNGWVIGFIAHSDGPVYQRDLEKRFSVRGSTMSNIISLMEKKGLITRVAASDDARLKRIELTDRALELHREIETDLSKINSKIVEGITPRELELFFSVIEKMEQNLEREEKDD